MECNFYVQIKDENGKQKICHIENICYGYDDFNIELSKYAWSGKSIYLACMINDTNKTEFYFYDDGDFRIIDRISIDVLSFRELEKFAQSGKFFDGVTWQPWKEEIPEENKSVIETYGTKCNFYIRLGNSNSFAHIEHLFDTDFDLTIATSSKSIRSRYIAEYKYSIGKKNPIGIYIYEKIDKNNKTCISSCGYNLLPVPFGTKDFDKNFTYKDLKKYRNSGKCFNNYSWVDFVSDTIQTVNKKEPEEKHDLWKDVDYTAWIAFQDDTPGITITKQFNSVADIREAEDHYCISNDEDIILVKDNTAYIISYAFSKGNIDYIFVLDQKDILKVLENNNSIKSPIVFNLYTTSSCKADEYMAPPDVCVTIKDILSNIILSTVTIYDLRYEGIHQGINTMEESKSDYSIKDIESVKFDPPYTFVIWKDNTIAFHKAISNELFDKRKGLAMCIVQKALGYDFEDVLKKFINEDPEEEEDD